MKSTGELVIQNNPQEMINALIESLTKIESAVHTLKVTLESMNRTGE